MKHDHSRPSIPHKSASMATVIGADALRGIRRRLTLIAVGVLVIAVIDGLFFLTHPETEWHECQTWQT